MRSALPKFLLITTNKFRLDGLLLPTATLLTNQIATTKSPSALMEFPKCTLLLNSLTLSLDLIEMLNTASKFALATLAVLVSALNQFALINALSLLSLLSPELFPTKMMQLSMSSGTTTPHQLASTRDATTPSLSPLTMARTQLRKPPGNPTSPSLTSTLLCNTASRSIAATTAVNPNTL